MTIEEYEKCVENLYDLVRIQRTPGNYDYDPYMHGLGNGLIVALSIFKKWEPIFLEAPKKWGKNKKKVGPL